MAVATKFYNYQSNPVPKIVDDALDRWGYSPALKELRDYLVGQGWIDLGYRPMARPVRGGKVKSTHTVGALDIRYADPGPGRDVGLWVLNGLLLPYSAELGIQAVHDYLGSRIWRPPGTSGRAKSGDGWRAQAKSATNGMGQAWADYFHIELHPDAFGDTGRLAKLLAQLGKPGAPTTPKPPPVVITPKPVPAKGITVQFTTTTVSINAKGSHVRRVQQMLNDLAGRGLATDGHCGLQTVAAIMDWQRLMTLNPATKNTKVDGIAGPVTLGSITTAWFAKA